ncbi:MAG TPA: nitroreductase family protein [Spirochaetia bacterium]|nr:nitroreductase family protein [Spirochaetia bacterium]
MEVLEAISRRRSIRKFQETPIPRSVVEKLLSAAVQAPSAKNRQPWRFVVLEGAARLKLARLMEQGAEFVESRGDSAGSCRGSARAVAQAPMTVLIFNPRHQHPGLIFDNVVYNAPDILSIGAMVQTMLLAAEDLGLGTLWICDILYAYPLIREWLDRDDELVTAVSIGHPDISPDARPRTPWGEITEWRENG